MSLPRYPEYKSCKGVALAAIPVHWEPSPLKRVVALVESGVSVNSVDEPAGPDAIGVLKTSCVYDGSFNRSENKAVVAEELDRVACPVKAGTLIVSRMNTPALVGAAGLVEESADNLFLPDRLWQVHFSGAIPKFAHYWTASPSYRAQVQMACAGTSASMQNLSQDEFLRFVLPLPPQDEQTAIATFLDRETAKIDALIAEQEKLIALLAEKRQATVSHAVTRGLNPDAPMKDSGVAWLGAVPAHWELKRIKHIKAPVPNAFVDGPFGSNLKSEHFIDDGDVFVIESNFATQNKIDERELKTISFAHFETVSRSEVVAGDIVVAKIGAQFGKASILPLLSKRSLVSGNSLKLTVNAETCTVGWIHLQLVNLKAVGEIDLLANGSAQPALSLGGMNTLPIVLPPLAEQTDLLEFVAQETSKLSALKSEAENAIALLKERRSALIAAAVTGQIDVRGLAPEELEVLG